MGGNMADLKELADETAKELLKAIRDQARKASDLKLLQLAQAYSLIVSAETTAELVDEGEAEPDQTWQAPITAD
jgi:post-segregation antitoxin (ccd killing protein)